MFRKATTYGFTFVEVLLVIGILGIIVGLAIPFYQSFQISSRLDDTTQEAIQTLRRAQLKAMASEDFSDFGVHFEPQRFVLFKGDAYNPADLLNETVNLPSVLSISPVADIVFSAIKGAVGGTASITIQTRSGETNTININELGVVNVL